MDELISRLPSEILVAIAVVALVGLVAIIVVVVFAVVSGREVVLWPPRIGAPSAGKEERQADRSSRSQHKVVGGGRPIAWLYFSDQVEECQVVIIGSGARNLAFGAAPDNDVVISSDSVSRHHFRIVIEPESHPGPRPRYTFSVHDTGSANGTFINGERVSSAVALSASAVLAAGGVEIEFETARTAA